MTCFECNSTAGHQIDVHIHEGRKAAEIASGKRAQDVRLSLSGSTISASVRIQNGKLDFRGDPRRSDPKAHAAFFETLRQASEEGSKDVSFNMSWKSKHDPWKESVAWLRVGYLYAFAALGYFYILRPDLELVRKQIRNPDERLTPLLVKRLQTVPDFLGIQFVFAPIEFRSIIVICGGRAIVLPDFEFPSTFEERILGTSNDRWPKNLSGEQLPLPRRPQFFLDFNPAIGRFISPDFAEARGDAV